MLSVVVILVHLLFLSLVGAAAQCNLCFDMSCDAAGSLKLCTTLVLLLSNVMAWRPSCAVLHLSGPPHPTLPSYFHFICLVGQPSGG